VSGLLASLLVLVGAARLTLGAGGGAFLIEFLNAVNITFFINLPK
jgi:hypothetical protein